MSKPSPHDLRVKEQSTRANVIKNAAAACLLLAPQTEGGGGLEGWLNGCARHGFAIARLTQYGCYVPDRTNEDRPWLRQRKFDAEPICIGFEPLPRYLPTEVLLGRLYRAGFKVGIKTAWVTTDKVTLLRGSAGKTYSRQREYEHLLHMLDISWPVERCYRAGWSPYRGDTND